MKQIVIFLVVVGFAYVTVAQTCQSGVLDPRVDTMLRTVLIDLPSGSTASVEQIRSVKINTSAFPRADVRYAKVTADSIPIQIYNPSKGISLPIIISYHPGGFVTPILPFMEYEFWREAKTYNAIVFAIDYRVAPENKYPAAVDDCYAAFRWVVEHGQEYGGDTSRIVIMGSSAGGNLAAVVTQKAKEDGVVQKIKLQVLNCPSTDDPRNAGRHPSYQQYASGYFLTKAFCQYYIQAYAPLEKPGNPEIGPINREDVSGLPPAIVITAEFDPLRDEGARYARRLKDAGVVVWYKCFPGQIHCLLGLPPEAKELKEVDEMIMRGMKRLLKGG